MYEEVSGGYDFLWQTAHRNIDRQRQATYRRLTDAEIKMATCKPEVLICKAGDAVWMRFQRIKFRFRLWILLVQDFTSIRLHRHVDFNATNIDCDKWEIRWTVVRSRLRNKSQNNQKITSALTPEPFVRFSPNLAWRFDLAPPDSTELWTSKSVIFQNPRNPR